MYPSLQYGASGVDSYRQLWLSLATMVTALKCLNGAGINGGLLRFDGQKGPIRDFAVCSIGCGYRAEMILGR